MEANLVGRWALVVVGGVKKKIRRVLGEMALFTTSNA